MDKDDDLVPTVTEPFAVTVVHDELADGPWGCLNDDAERSPRERATNDRGREQDAAALVQQQSAAAPPDIDASPSAINHTPASSSVWPTGDHAKALVAQRLFHQSTDCFRTPWQTRLHSTPVIDPL